jgi:N-acyl-D-aspartate/D-glutamate deacylase
MVTINHNTSVFPARMLCESGIKNMCKRGKIQKGMIADITSFNPNTVKENSDYAPGKNGLPTTGIWYVLVNGNIGVRDSKVDLKVRAGQPIREDIIT